MAYYADKAARQAELDKVHADSVVYAKVPEFGANNNITFEAILSTDHDSDENTPNVDVRVPINTLNNNKLESHFFFKRPDAE